MHPIVPISPVAPSSKPASASAQLMTAEPVVSSSLLSALRQERVLLLATRGQEQVFLVLAAVREWSTHAKYAGNPFKLLVVASSEAQCPPWRKCLFQLTQLDEDQVIVSTKSNITGDGYALVVVLNAQKYLRDYAPVSSWVPLAPDTRLLCLSSPIVPELPVELLLSWDPLLERMRKQFDPCVMEANGDLVAQLQNQIPPKMSVLLHSTDTLTDLSLEGALQECISGLLTFLDSHVCDMAEMYSDYADVKITDPKIVPIVMLKEWVEVLDDFGPWAAERAALILCLQIDQLKMMEKYERHFMLLGLLHTELSRMRRMIEKHYQDLPEIDRLMKYSRPKLLRLVSVLAKFKPAHVGAVAKEMRRRKGCKAAAAAKKAEGEAEETSEEIKEEAEEIMVSEEKPSEEKTSEEAEETKFSEEKTSEQKTSEQVKEIKATTLHEVKLEVIFSNESKTCMETRISDDECTNLKDEPLPEPAKADDAATEEPKSNTPAKDSDDKPDKKPKSIFHGRKRKSRKDFTSYEDPHGLHCAIYVQRPFHAKVLYHFMHTLSREDDNFSFLSPQYVVSMEEMGETSSDASYIANKRKREEALRRFRVRESNLLITPSYQEPGLETVRCNLVVAMDPPKNFFQHANILVKAKGGGAAGSAFLLFSKPDQANEILCKLAQFQIIQERFASICLSAGEREAEDDTDIDLKALMMPAFHPGSTEGPSATLDNAVSLVNRYCSKLPSDSFTRLSPVHQIVRVNAHSFICGLQLPINSPLKKTVYGSAMPSRQLARNAAALEVVRRLHGLGELDDNLAAQGKEAMHREVGKLLRQKEKELNDKQQEKELNDKQEDGNVATPDVKEEEHVRNLGTTKRRQYYVKQVAPALRPDPKADKSSLKFTLYSLSMKLMCAIPDDQNTRGRRVHPPEAAEQSFGFLSRGSLPPICPFPIYTRSGEVAVNLEKVKELEMTEEHFELVNHFHSYTFSQVLRLEKHPMVFDPNNGENALLVVPLSKQDGKRVIDTEFLTTISAERDNKLARLSDTDRKDFKFDPAIYADAVVMPWYRNQDQPQYFYVAEICKHLGPKSAFPGSGFKTFEKYYAEKYQIVIQNVDGQPLLDVDHTSARLNFLTPRYVNRKGVALPTSSEATKKSKRENLDQKQILVPELCSIHPFKASLWRQTVCLPSIFYRLNGLFIADNLRLTVAKELSLGVPTLPQNHKWEMLHFGWTLSDVLKTRKSKNEPIDINTINTNKPWIPRIVDKPKGLNKSIKASSPPSGQTAAATANKPKRNIDSLSEQLVDKMTEDEKLKKKDLDIGTWDNEMAFKEAEQSDTRHEKAEDGDDEKEGEESDWDEELEDEDFTFPDNLTILKSDTIFPGMNLPSPSPQPSSSGTSSPGCIPPTRNATKHRPSSTNGCSRKPKSTTSNDTWGTGIETKLFKVDVPIVPTDSTAISSMIMDDLEGLSCSDTDEEKEAESRFTEINSDDEDVSGGAGGGGDNWKGSKEVAKMGGTTIEFKGDNTAEAIEDEQEEKDRLATLLKDRVEDAAMTEELKWPKEFDGYTMGCEKLVEDVAARSTVLKADEKLTLQPDMEWERPVKPAYPARQQVEGEEQQQKEVEVQQASFATEAEIETAKKDLTDRITFPPLQNALTSNILARKRKESQAGLVVPDGGEDIGLPAGFSFDAQPELDAAYPGPSPNLLLQAITMSNSNDAINLERLETIGDSFLKYAITAFLFCHHPLVHEGKLSHMRSKQVSNVHLYQLGRRKRLGEIMIATKFEPYDNWLPPGYMVPASALELSSEPPKMHQMPSKKKIKKQALVALKDGGGEKKEDSANNTDDEASLVPYNLLTQHSIPDKSVADCVESLIGTYLISSGPKGALQFMTWLGLSLQPEEGAKNGFLVMPKSPLMQDTVEEPERQLDLLLAGYEEFEDLIGYKFKDRSYLLQAFTHASYWPNRLTDCYQRLEFLGDAVLDYIITRFLYEDPRKHSPGTLTDLRSALVNNTIFASLAVKFKFHKFFRHLSPALQTVINRFVRIQGLFHDHILLHEDSTAPEAEAIFPTTEIGTEAPSVGSGDPSEAEDVEVPKALGDIFESVAGAIYLDSGLNLDTVWTVYYRMMRPEIELFSTSVPKSPIRELLEMEPETVRFGKPEKLSDGRRVRVSVDVFGRGTFKGIGRNYRIAKSTAAKCALRALKRIAGQNETAMKKQMKMLETETK